MAGEGSLTAHAEAFFVRDVLGNWDATVRELQTCDKGQPRGARRRPPRAPVHRGVDPVATIVPARRRRGPGHHHRLHHAARAAGRGQRRARRRRRRWRGGAREVFVEMPNKESGGGRRRLVLTCGPHL